MPWEKATMPDPFLRFHIVLGTILPNLFPGWVTREGGLSEVTSNILHSLTPMRAENGQLPWLAAYCQYKISERSMNIRCSESRQTRYWHTAIRERRMVGGHKKTVSDDQERTLHRKIRPRLRRYKHTSLMLG
jgi:hypothetical protein